MVFSYTIYIYIYDPSTFTLFGKDVVDFNDGSSQFNILVSVYKGLSEC